jgi:hypothetical protein
MLYEMPEGWCVMVNANARTREYEPRGNFQKGQGGLVFLPRPDAPVDPVQVQFAATLEDAAGDQYACDRLFEYPGQQVHVCMSCPYGLTDEEFAQLSRLERKRWDWHVVTRDACTFVKGVVRHAEHAPVWLDGWHEVMTRAPRGNQGFVYLD